jgi:hypothetical protein
MDARSGSSISTTCCAPVSPDRLNFCQNRAYITAMQNKTRKRGPLTSEDQFDLKEAKASYVAMPSWQRIAIWLALGMLLLGILGDLIW